jgi:hypothetical protein
LETPRHDATMSYMPGRLGDRWDAEADSFGSPPAIARLARRLAELVGTAKGEPALDVGTGTGLALIAHDSIDAQEPRVGFDRAVHVLPDKRRSHSAPVRVPIPRRHF